MDIDSPAPSAAPDQPQSTPADQGPAPTAASQPSPGAAGPSSTGKPASQHASPIPSASGADAASPAVDAQKSAQSGTESAAAEGHSSTEQQSQHPPSALASLASLAEARERGATPSSTASEHVAQGGLAESAAKPIANGHHNDDEAMDVIEDNETGGEHEHADHDATSSSSGSCPMSSVASGAATIDVPVANPEDSAEDMDRFIKRMEVEKKISQLQQRLELASIKTNHGWSDMSIKEIETRLPSPQEAKRTQVVNGGGRYDPPSPSRPWQLADVLWQPLPQPGRSIPSKVARPPGGPFHAPSASLPGQLPSANGSTQRAHPPNSPRRHRMDEYLNRPQASPLRHSSKNGGSGHRRASSSISSLQFLQNDPYRGGSPLRPKQKSTGKKRSQSHSNLREANQQASIAAQPQHRPAPTTQDVDAARALTSMLGSVRSPTDGQFPQQQPPGGGDRGMHPRAMHLPPLHTSSLPGPFTSAPDMPPPRPRAQSFAAESREPFEHALGPGHERKRSTEYRPYLPPPPRRHGGPTHARGLSMDSSAAFRDRFAPPPWPAQDERFRERSGERGERYGSSERYGERYPSVERYGPGERFGGPERYGGYGAAFGYNAGAPSGGLGGPGGPPGGPGGPPGGPPGGAPPGHSGHGHPVPHTPGPGYDAYRVEEEPMAGRGEEDKAAAELMMFLATSPSPNTGPVRGKREHASIAGTARVLFDDREPPPYPRPGPPPLSAAPRR